jgi:hypothetical protein
MADAPLAFRNAMTNIGYNVATRNAINNQGYNVIGDLTLMDEKTLNYLPRAILGWQAPRVAGNAGNNQVRLRSSPHAS